jgi:hypothetical protein
MIEKILHTNGNHQHVSVAILISEKTDLKTETIKRDKQCH